MERYLMTHSLLSSWLFAISENPYEDLTTTKNSMAEFLQVLRREPTETTEAMQNGIVFEDMVTCIATGTQTQSDTHDPWFEAAQKAAGIVRGGVFQFKAYKEIKVNGMVFLLHGRLDVLKAGEIIDIKFSKGYERGKYFDSTQHPMYFELVPEAMRFVYLVSNGNEVWTESYRREETSSILPVISDFVDWLTATGYIDIYKEHWSVA